ncbi:MAG: response regulator [Bacteroidota bacterium]
MANTHDEKVKTDILNTLSNHYIQTDRVLAEKYNRESIELAEKINYDKGMAEALYVSFKIFKLNDEKEKALISVRNSGLFFLKAKDFKSYADCLVDESSIFIKKRDFKKATKLLEDAQKIYETICNRDELALFYSTLGSLYYQEGKFDEALKYHEKSLEINLKKKFTLGISVNYVNIGNALNAKKKYQAAIEYFLKAVDLKIKVNDQMGMLKCYNNIGVTFMNMGNPVQAIIFHKKGLEFSLNLKSEYDVCLAYINLGFDYQKARDYNNAILYTLKGLAIAQKSCDIQLIMESNRVLSECYASKNNYADAYKHLLIFKQNSDSLLKVKNDKELNEIQIRFETSQKDYQINALKIDSAAQQVNLQRTRIYVLLFLGLFIIVTSIVILLYKQSKNNKKIQAKLKEINDIKSAFFANLSHEFRTPLTLMLGPLEKLLEKATTEDKIYLQLIHRNASRLLALDEQLLEFTRIDSGNQKLKLSKGNIISLVSAVAESFVLIAENKNIRFGQHYPDEKIDAFFDGDIVEKIIGNLLSNAIKYTETGGNVDITVSFIESENKTSKNLTSYIKTIQIEVSDNGQGIPGNKQNLIFERFYQLNNYTSGIYDGYGIGLALVKELILLHKGQILLKSSEGEGSQFTVLLPIDPGAYHADDLNKVSALKTPGFAPVEITTFENNDVPAITIEKEENISDEKQRLLVVDDNPDMRAYLSEILREIYEVTLASDGGEGLESAINCQPDLIITDIMMIKMDGIEFCQKLKLNPNTRHIPVIMLTALTDLEDKIRGLENGADDYIKKPFHEKELKVRIINLINQRKFLKDLFTKELKLEPQAISISSSDTLFIQKTIRIIEKNMDNSDLDVEFLARELAISRSQLHRKITSITGQAASSFIRIIRIKRAAQMMQQKSGNISEIMYSVGFNNLSYFSKNFKEVYQMTPSEYLNMQ